MEGIYYYRYPVQLVPVLQLETYALPVEIVGQNEKRYWIKYLAPHQDGSPVGSLHKVLKRKVVLQRTPPRDIRLPYKD